MRNVNRNVIRIASTFLLLFIIMFAPTCFPESVGNITLSSPPGKIVTGLWGMTVSTATTTTVASSSTDISPINVVGSETTTTTTTIVTASTTTTTAMTTTNKDIPVSNNYTSSEISSALENNVLLKKSIDGFIKDSSVDIYATVEIEKDISAKKSLNIGADSQIEVRIYYSGEKTVKNFMVYDTIPKTFASSINDITIESNAGCIPVESDPSYLCFVPLLKKSDTIFINYTVSKKVNPSEIGTSGMMIFTTGYEGLQEQIGGFPLIWVAVLAFTVSAVIVVLILFKNSIMDMIAGGDKKYKYRPRQDAASDIKKAIEDAIKKIKERLTGKKEAPKFVYRYNQG